MYRQHCSHCHPLATCIHMCIAALQSLTPTGHVYPYVYRQYCSHCHPLATCIHMCIASTAATVAHWPRVSICVSLALQPLSPTGHVYPYVYRQHCSHCHPLATCIHMCIGSTAATVTHWPRACCEHIQEVRTPDRNPRFPNDTAVQVGACLLTRRNVCLASFGTASVTRRRSCTA